MAFGFCIGICVQKVGWDSEGYSELLFFVFVQNSAYTSKYIIPPEEKKLPTRSLSPNLLLKHRTVEILILRVDSIWVQAFKI